MKETQYDRKLRMLRQLNLTCRACTMCELGRREAVKDDIARDPHVLSNMNPTRIVVVGQNPGWQELKQGEPFVGAAGKNFDAEVAKHGLSRKDFYITNVVKCWTSGNAKPDYKHVARCNPFLQMELALIRPALVVALGAVAFGHLCPDITYANGLKAISKSEQYGVKVFAIYHPSPLNLSQPDRKRGFEEQIKILCKIIKKLGD